MADPARVSVWIAHTFQPGASNAPYGSQRASQRARRSLALARCIGALVAMPRQRCEPVLSPAAGGWQQAVGAEAAAVPLRDSLSLEIHLCVLGEAWLPEAVESYANAVQVHQLEGVEPRHLPAATRDQLLQDPTPCDLSVYLEDDLVLQDPLSLDKWLWFAQITQHRAVLMPHRFEPVPGRGRAYVDGAISPGYLQSLAWPQGQPFEASFWPGCPVAFHPASNPHAGVFALSGPQRQLLRQCMPLPLDGFVGPLETAATATVAAHWPVFKPAWPQRQFLQVEHGHPTFRSHLGNVPLLEQPAT